MRIAILGAGSWGTALAQMLAGGQHETCLWARDQVLAQRLASTRCNDAYMPGVQLRPSVRVSGDLAEVVEDAAIAIMAVPTHGMRAIVESCAPLLRRECLVVSAAKGFEERTCMTMSEVIVDTLGEMRRSQVAAISGPNIAPEIAAGKPAATVVASADEKTAMKIRDACTGPQLRFYSNCDLIGVEYGGALKNVVAIAAGACDGMEVGDNGKAAIITRGIAEMSRLGAAAGARPLTFAGLTGLGDCIVTCMSGYSRNRRLGEAVGRGKTLEEALAATTMVVEGVNATRVAVGLAEKHAIDMPIAREVHSVLFENKKAGAALADLMSRGTVDE
ncbi:MAG TPA: NAD(P)H-dependent glycerol-3-phosphate dehydrogenase [Candidatus Sulfotelmatobacter sp.]|nr:NAD(P)H-dependent glycerol-3-phosphate dehydrogenase [Candidatus Sulfotelmatobacter sp.]